MSDRPSTSVPDWAEIDAVLDRALDLEGPERAAFLQGLDPAVRARIERALTGHGADVVDALIQTSLAGLPGNGGHGTPESIGPWRLLRELGAGGMAQVFEARRVEADFEQRSALKILWPFRAGAEFHDRFVQERRILAGISHPGIAGLLDGGMLPDRRPWFAMEYVEGRRIDDFCRDLSLTQRLQVFLQVCDAVEFAHGRLIVHRDIKPANILVDETGRVRLLDFGIAKILDAADDGAMTRTGGSLLTLQYASPEQVTNAPLTVATDVYQLGMLLYQLLAGQLPYDLQDRSLKQAIEVICSTEPG
jgi:eukaryotic-like serine/threonine-protein kinase